MSYDTYLTNQTNRHLDEQSRPNTDTCSWCGRVQLTEDMIDGHLESFCSEECMDKFEEDCSIGQDEAEEKMG